MGDNDTTLNGFLPQRIPSCLSTIDIFLQQSHEILCSAVIAEKDKPSSDSKANLVKTIARVIGIEDVNLVNPDDRFTNLGMDSLGFVAIKQILERKYNIFLSSENIFSLTISKLRTLASSLSGNS